MDRQMQLIPISQAELNTSAYRMAKLLEAVDIAVCAFEEAKKAHKEHLGALRTEITEMRSIIRRAELEQEEGLMSAQVDVLFRQADEQHE